LHETSFTLKGASPQANRFFLPFSPIHQSSFFSPLPDLQTGWHPMASIEDREKKLEVIAEL